MTYSLASYYNKKFFSVFDETKSSSTEPEFLNNFLMLKYEYKGTK